MQPYATTVFAEMSALAARVGAVNLGQGFPDEDGPPAMLKAAQDAIAEGVNQYPPGIGVATLREAIAAQRKRHLRHRLRPGHRSAGDGRRHPRRSPSAVLGLVEPGSEVILIQPFYDSYSPVVAMAGAEARGRAAGARRPRLCARHRRAARAPSTPRTRALMRELAAQPHRHGAQRELSWRLSPRSRWTPTYWSSPTRSTSIWSTTAAGTCRWPASTGMAERTVTISSAAKMFNCTGWKIGWACGPAELILGVRAAKQYLSYVGGAPFQPAVAYALNTEEIWVAALRASLQDRRDRLARGLTEVGFRVHDSAGTYFLCADPRPLGYDDSTAFCAALPERVGVAAIPMTAFCDPAAPDYQEWNHLVRFTFCKREDTLDEAIRRLASLGDRADLNR